MKKILVNTLVTIWLCSTVAANLVYAHEAHEGDVAKLKLENLSRDKLAGVENTEVIVSRVSIPPNTSLPKHWHPGEEFAYVIEGSVILWQEGKPDMLIQSGGAAKVPLKQVHTAKTQDSGAVIVVFRVHEMGKKERYPAK